MGDAPDQQSSSCHQHDGQEHLRKNERTLHSTPGGDTTGLASLPQDLTLEASLEQASNRDGRDDGAHDQREDQGATQRRPIQRQRVLEAALQGQTGHQDVEEPGGQHHAERSRHDAEGDGLREDLAGEAPAPGAQRRPDGQLAAPIRRPGENEGRDVRASHQQEEPDGAQQEQKGGSDVAQQELPHRSEEGPVGLVPRLRIGELLSEGCGEACQLLV